MGLLRRALKLDSYVGLLRGTLTWDSYVGLLRGTLTWDSYVGRSTSYRGRKISRSRCYLIYFFVTNTVCKQLYYHILKLHARWMSKALYTLKVNLFLPQFPSLPCYRKKQLEKMSLFIVFVYLKSWFTVSLLYSAATADLELYQRMRKLSKVHKKIAEVGETMRNFIRELCPGVFYTYGEPIFFID